MSSKTITLSYQTYTEFDTNTRDLNLHLEPDTGAVSLAKGVTYADEMGNCNMRDLELVSGTQLIRKEFWIDNPNADGAALLPYIMRRPDPGSRLRITINDIQTVVFEEPRERDYWTDGWTNIPIPVDVLQPGLNTFVFQADGEETWGFLIEQGCLPNRSAKSRDAGRNWDDECLGENHACDGEYMIRLRIDQYASDGVMESRIVDVGSLASEDGIAVPLQLNRIASSWHVDQPGDTEIQMRYRLGSTPEYEFETWTDWCDFPNAISPDGLLQCSDGRRYLQWQLILRTGNPSVTPRVEGLEIMVDVDVGGEVGEPLLELAEQNIPEIVRGSHHFAYLAHDTKRAEIFRERWKLDEVIADATSEFDRFVRLSAWVRHQWENGWNSGDIDFCPPWDGMLILELASRKLSLGMCTHYSTVFVHACASLGLIARTVVVGRHCVAEAWSEEYDKWIMVDTGGDSRDETKATYSYTRDGVPMSTLEVHTAWVNQDFDGLAIEPEHAAKRFEDSLTTRTGLFDSFCITRRNDELRTLSPGEPEHGKAPYHYDGYLWWKDNNTPPNPWFSRKSNRIGDFYWTPNRTMIYLSRCDDSEVLDVDFTTTAPNLKHYLVQIDRGDWKSQPNHFGWQLRDGENHLRVKSVNQWGWEGKESHVLVKRM